MKHICGPDAARQPPVGRLWVAGPKERVSRRCSRWGRGWHWRAGCWRPGTDCRAASLMGAKGFSLRPPPTGPLRPAREAHRGSGKLVACWGCRDEVPRTGWLQRSTGLGVGGLKWRCQQGPRGRVCPQPLAAADNPRGPSACRHVTPVSAFGVTRHAPRASVSECPLPVGTLVTLQQSPPQPPRFDHVFKGPVST